MPPGGAAFLFGAVPFASTNAGPEITSTPRALVPSARSAGPLWGVGETWVQCLPGDSHGNSFIRVGSLLLNSSPNTGGQAAGLKGRLNFAMSAADAVNQSRIAGSQRHQNL